MTQKGYSPPKGFNLDKAFIQSLSLAVNKGKKNEWKKSVFTSDVKNNCSTWGV